MINYIWIILLMLTSMYQVCVIANNNSLLTNITTLTTNTTYHPYSDWFNLIPIGIILLFAIVLICGRMCVEKH